MIYRSAFILPVAIRDQANAFAAQIGIDSEALLNTLSVPLVPAAGASDAQPTHYACCGILTAAQRAQLEAASGSFPGALWWWWEELDAAQPLAASHDGAQLGEAWSWARCLEAAGLQVRRSGAI